MMCVLSPFESFLKILPNLPKHVQNFLANDVKTVRSWLALCSNLSNLCTQGLSKLLSNVPLTNSTLHQHSKTLKNTQNCQTVSTVKLSALSTLRSFKTTDLMCSRLSLTNFKTVKTVYTQNTQKVSKPLSVFLRASLQDT